MSSTQQTAQNVQPTDAKKETKQGEKKQKNKIQVSSTKQTLSFYVYLAKRLMATENTVELSGLGNAINTVVSCAEILKNSGVAEITKIETSTVEVQQNGKKNAKPINKPKIQIFLQKSKDFDAVIKKQEEERAQKQQQKKQENKKEGKEASPAKKQPQQQ